MEKSGAANLINLDECVVNALSLFTRKRLPKLKLGHYGKALVVGSGNAAATGRIIMKGSDTVFADESTYKEKLKAVKGIDSAILISASGGKHAPIIAKELRKRKIKTTLLTNNKNAAAKKFSEKTVVLPKNAEPYTYNTSTYLGMIIAKTRESPKNILDYINKAVKPRIPKNLSKYDSYFILVPAEFDDVREMFLTKFDELFGSRISGRVFTPEQAKHAKTVVESDKELFVSLGCSNKGFGRKRIDIPLPKWAREGTVIAAGYYFIGHIQKQNPQYFKKSILKYTKKASRMFGQDIKPIAE